MKKRVAGKKFKRTTDGRKQLFRALVINFVRNGRMVTTATKAGVARRLVEKVVTHAKIDSVAARRNIFADYPQDAVLKHLFEIVAPAFKDRNGGYTRILRLPRRVGDSAQEAMLEWVIPIAPIVAVVKEKKPKKTEAKIVKTVKTETEKPVKPKKVPKKS